MVWISNVPWRLSCRSVEGSTVIRRWMCRWRKQRPWPWGYILFWSLSPTPSSIYHSSSCSSPFLFTPSHSLSLVLSPPPSSLPSLDLHKLRLTQPQFLCHDVLPYHRPRNNKAKWPWTESSEIILPSMLIFSCIIFTTTECYHIVLYHVSLYIYKIYN